MENREDKIEACEVVVVHNIVDRVRKAMPEEAKFYNLAELFKVFGDTTRVKILFALSESEMRVCDIASLLNMSHSAISHQLRILKQSRLVRSRREGKTVYYSLADEHVKKIFEQGFSHVSE